MREKLLIKLADWAVNKTRWVITVVIMLTLFLGFLASNIQMSPKWSDMLPKEIKEQSNLTVF